MERIKGLAWDLMDAIYEVNYDGAASEFSVRDKESEVLSIVIFSGIVERVWDSKKFKFEIIELINEYKKECKDYSEIIYRMTEIGGGVDVDGTPINEVENISYDIDKDSEFFCIEENEEGRTTIVGFSNEDVLDMILEYLWDMVEDRMYRRHLAEILMETE